MFRVLNISASSAEGSTAQPIRPPVHEYDFEAPEAMMVRSAMPGSEAMEKCRLPSNRMFS